MPRRILRLFREDSPWKFKLLGAAVVAAVAVIALGFTLVYRVNTTQEFRDLSIQNCVELEQIKAQIRGVFTDGRRSAYQRYVNGEITLRQWSEMRDRYDRQLARFAPNRC